MLNDSVIFSSTSSIEFYKSSNDSGLAPVIIILPGGNYTHTTPREKMPVVNAFVEKGFACVVLDYTTYSKLTDTHLDRMYADVELAYKTIVINAKVWGIDVKKIFLCGFSAGGHLAAIAGSRLGRRRIKGVILGYPAMGIEHIWLLNNRVIKKVVPSRYLRLFKPRPADEISRRTPPTFIWHTGGDLLVSPRGSLEYAQRLLGAGVPCELHIYQKGHHALSTATAESARFKFQIMPHVATWVELASSWASSLSRQK